MVKLFKPVSMVEPMGQTHLITKNCGHLKIDGLCLDMALIENNANVAAEMAVNFTEVCQSFSNSTASNYFLSSKKQPVNLTNLKIY